MVAAAMATFFPTAGSLENYCNNPAELAKVIAEASNLIPPALLAKLHETGRVPTAGDVKYIFLTKAGPGPIRQPLSESLLSPATGLPVPPSSKHKRMVIASAEAVGPSSKDSDEMNRKLDSAFYSFLVRDVGKMLFITGATLGFVVAARAAIKALNEKK